jgi:hypothetical protein
VADNTALRILDGGQFILEYQLEGGVEQVVTGTFTLTSSEVRLRADEEFQARLQSMLLDRAINMERNPDNPNVLTYEQDKTVNLEEYAPERYEDLTDISGTLMWTVRKN